MEDPTTSNAVSQTQEVSPDKPKSKTKKAWMSWKKVAILKQSPTTVTTVMKVTQDLADGSTHIITTTSPPYNKYFCNLHGYQLIMDGELDDVVHKDYGTY